MSTFRVLYRGVYIEGRGVQCDMMRYTAMGWLSLVGSIKLLVSFAKEPCKRVYSAKEFYNYIDPTNCSHPIFITGLCVHTYLYIYT